MHDGWAKLSAKCILQELLQSNWRQKWDGMKNILVPSLTDTEVLRTLKKPCEKHLEGFLKRKNTKKGRKIMTYEQRERIFSKEYIYIDEFMELTGVTKGAASVMMSNIRRKYNRLGIKGKIHVQDYFDYYDLNPADYRLSIAPETLKTLAEAIAKELAYELRNGAAS